MKNKITKLFLTSVVLLMMITGFATITSAETLNKGTPLTNENTKEESQLQGLPTKLYIKDLFKTFSKSQMDGWFVTVDMFIDHNIY